MRNLAFLFPLSTLNTLKLVVNDKHPKLKYYPEAQANQITRVKELKIKRDKKELSDESMEKLMSCLLNLKRKRYRLTLKKPLPKTWVAACAKQSGIPLKGEDRIYPPFIKITNESDSHYFQYEMDGSLTIFCRDNSPCSPCQQIPLPQQDSKAFYIHPTYDDALVRFRFIDEIMNIFKLWYGLFFILLVQVGIVITHRKHNYGILLSKGVSCTNAWNGINTNHSKLCSGNGFCNIDIDEGMQWLL